MSKPNLFQELDAKFDAMSLRERSLVFYALPLTIIVMFFFLLIEPSVKESWALDDKIERAQSQLDSVSASLNEVIAELKVDPNLPIKEQIAQTEKSIEEVTALFAAELDELVPPQAMPILLEQLLAQTGSLSLQSMTSVPPVNVFEGQEDKADIELFKHGIKLSFVGNYFDTQAFLSAAENLGWKLYWQEISYSVEDYPLALVELELFTLSTSEVFISVN